MEVVLTTSLSFSSLLSEESEELLPELLLELLPLSEDMIPMTALSWGVGIFPANWPTRWPPMVAGGAVGGPCWRVAGGTCWRAVGGTCWRVVGGWLVVVVVVMAGGPGAWPLVALATSSPPDMIPD